MDKLRNFHLSLHTLSCLPASEKKMTLSTIITLSRIILTPFIVYAMVGERWGIAFVLFLIAAVTDMFDGMIARLRNEQTFLGASLDALADKILILAAFFTLAFIKTPLFVLPPFFVFFILIKEVLQIVGVVFLFVKKGYITISPTRIGKLTTVMHISFIIWLFACYFFNWMPIKTYYIMLIVMMIMVTVSLVQYGSIGIRLMMRL